jgi:hypothetical protein
VLQLKDLWWRTVGEIVTAWDENILEELEELLGGRPWEAGTEDRCPSNRENIAYRYRPCPGIFSCNLEVIDNKTFERCRSKGFSVNGEWTKGVHKP